MRPGLTRGTDSSTLPGSRVGKPMRGSNGGLDRIRYTGKPIYMPKSLRVKKDLIEIGFHEKLSKPQATDLTKYKLGAWNLKWSHAYGSPEIPVGGLELKKSNFLMMEKRWRCIFQT